MIWCTATDVLEDHTRKRNQTAAGLRHCCAYTCKRPDRHSLHRYAAWPQPSLSCCHRCIVAGAVLLPSLSCCRNRCHHVLVLLPRLFMRLYETHLWHFMWRCEQNLWHFVRPRERLWHSVQLCDLCLTLCAAIWIVHATTAGVPSPGHTLAPLLVPTSSTTLPSTEGLHRPNPFDNSSALPNPPGADFAGTVPDVGASLEVMCTRVCV